MTAPLTPPEALIYAMVTTSAVDRRITDDELSRIGSIVKELPPFYDFDRDWLIGEAQDCGKVLARPDGLSRCSTSSRRLCPSVSMRPPTCSPPRSPPPTCA